MIKKILKIVLISIFFCVIFSQNVFAKTTYQELYEDLPLDFDFEGYSLLEDYNLTPKDENWINNLNAKNILEIIKDLIVNGYKVPLTAFLSVTAAVLITAAFSSFLKENEYFLSFILIAAAASVLLPLFNTLTSAMSVLQVISDFMLLFIPTFIGLVISGGMVGAASVSAPMLLFVTNAVAKISTDGFLPLMGGYLSLTISGSLSPVFSLNNLAISIKNAANFIMGICTTLFLGVLSISNTVVGASDSLALKTTRFLINGVPVVGSAIAESLAATTAATDFLKSSVGAWGIVAIAIIVLPILINLLLWKLSLFLSSFVADILDIKNISGFLNAVSAVISVTIGILIFVSMLFIISLAILIKTRK